LGTIGDVLQRAKELAVQASNGTNSSSDTQAIAQEANQLYQQLIKLSNTNYAGRYIFSGYKTDQTLILDKSKSFTYTNIQVLSGGGPPANTFRLKHDNVSAVTNISGSIGGGAAAPFTIVAGPPAASGEVQVDTTTGQLTFFPTDVASGLTNLTASYNLNRNAGDYNPDAYSYINTTQTTPLQGESIRYDIGINDKININVIGSDLFGNTSAGSNSGVQLENFGKFVNALTTSNQAGIQQAISDLEIFSDSVLQQRADIGARTNRMDLTKSRFILHYLYIN
jgi:flagellin-like hook-associated protein FlgL